MSVARYSVPIYIIGLVMRGGDKDEINENRLYFYLFCHTSEPPAWHAGEDVILLLSLVCLSQNVWKGRGNCGW